MIVYALPDENSYTVAELEDERCPLCGHVPNVWGDLCDCYQVECAECGRVGDLGNTHFVTNEGILCCRCQEENDARNEQIAPINACD